MIHTAKSSGKVPASHKRAFGEARPLLQAIAVGLLLATALMVAAALANPDGRPSRDVQGATVSKPQPARTTLPTVSSQW